MQTGDPNRQSPGGLNHPNDEEWVQLLYGQLLSERRRELAVHLAQCSRCAGQVRILKHLNGVQICNYMTPTARALAF